jgi:hypothetical protein
VVEEDIDLDEEPFSLAGEEIPAEVPTEQIDELISELRRREAYAELFAHPEWDTFAQIVREKEQAAVSMMRSGACATLDDFTAMRATANTCNWCIAEPQTNAERLAEINAQLGEIQREDEREEEPE